MLGKEIKNIEKNIMTDLSILIIFSVFPVIIGEFIFQFNIQESNIVVIYILFVLLTSRFTNGYLYGIASSIISVPSYNYFFTAPYFSLSVYDSSYFITFFVMMLISIITSAITSKAKRQTKIAKDREQKLKSLYKIESKMEQEKFKNNLLKSISHDLRTPLSVILGNAQIIMHISRHDSEEYLLAEDIYKDSEWLKNLVENILSLAKIQDGKLEIKKENEYIEEIIGFCINTVERKNPNRNYIVEVKDDDLCVKVDGKLISQVLINLLNNSVKNTNDNDEIIVSIEKINKLSDTFVEIKVIDSGKGIKEEDLDKIFKSFYSSDNFSDSQRGVGLGLSICKSIIKAHGGEITAANRKDKKGAVFTFILPMEDNNE